MSNPVSTVPSTRPYAPPERQPSVPLIRSSVRTLTTPASAKLPNSALVGPLITSKSLIASGKSRLQSLYPSACPFTGSLIGTPSIQSARSVEWSELNPRERTRPRRSQVPVPGRAPRGLRSAEGDPRCWSRESAESSRARRSSSPWARHDPLGVVGDGHCLELRRLAVGAVARSRVAGGLLRANHAGREAAGQRAHNAPGVRDEQWNAWSPRIGMVLAGHTDVRRGAARVVTRACGRSADVRCWRTDRWRSAVFGLRRDVRGVPNGKPGRRPRGGRGERDAGPNNCDRRRIAARSRACAASRMVPGIAVRSGSVRRAGDVVRRASGEAACETPADAGPTVWATPSCMAHACSAAGSS